MEEVKLLPVGRSQIADWWDTIQPLMSSFYERSFGRYKPEDVLERLQDGNFQLWLAIQGPIVKAACMTHIITYPQLLDMRIFMMVGEDRDLWLGLLEKIEGYARAFGCAKLSGEARVGWERVLRPLGYEKTHIYVEKDL